MAERVIHIWVKPDESRPNHGRFYPGTAHVEIDGNLVAKLRGMESYTITVHEPSLSTSSLSVITPEERRTREQLAQVSRNPPSLRRRAPGETGPGWVADLGPGPHVGTDDGGELC